jgi:hypothetical protein
MAWATWPALPTSVWMSTYALSIPALIPPVAHITVALANTGCGVRAGRRR